MKTAIFLGAGASAAEGAPLQTNLFRDYFKLVKSRSVFVSPDHERDLVTFFLIMFGIDVDHGNLDKLIFPTFEEALGVLDLADLKDESFRHFQNISLASNSGQIKFLRLYLIYLMADIINNNLTSSKNIHRTLVRKLNQAKTIQNTIFITTNYDILCDNVLSDLYPKKKIDYGIDFINFVDGTFQPPGKAGIKLFKLHGSLNWLHCSTCNNVRITLYEKGVYKLMTEPEHATCPNCGTFYSPIIVPPTFFKNFSKVFLNQVWNKAEFELLDVDHLVFCGYSFPDADMHVKYLIKRIQKNRPDSKPLKISVVNNHPGKTDATKKEEKNRFVRFLGFGVDYTNYSFEEFANDPFCVIT